MGVRFQVDKKNRMALTSMRTNKTKIVSPKISICDLRSIKVDDYGCIFWGLSCNSLSRKPFSRFESDSFARRYRNFRSGSRIPANSALARFNDEDAEPPEFNAFTF